MGNFNKIWEGTEGIGNWVNTVGSAVWWIKDQVAYWLSEVLWGGKISKTILNAVNVGTDIIAWGGRYSAAILWNWVKLWWNLVTLRRKSAFTNDLRKFWGAFLEPLKDFGKNTYKIWKEDSDLRELSVAKWSLSSKWQVAAAA